jgi:AraC-like DNA-binding protein
MQSAYDITTDRLESFVNEHAAERLTLDDVARHMHMNRTYACEVFHRKTGCTFTQYVAQARLELAKRLLMGEGKLCTVARDSGYGSEVSFYRAFKRATGITPGEYRAAFTPGRAAGQER